MYSVVYDEKGPKPLALYRLWIIINLQTDDVNIWPVCDFSAHTLHSAIIYNDQPVILTDTVFLLITQNLVMQCCNQLNGSPKKGKCSIPLVKVPLGETPAKFKEAR